MQFITKSPVAFCSAMLVFALVSCLFVGESMAGGKGKGGGDDIILYNGNIVVRGNGGGKGKGKGSGGSIVVANSHGHDGGHGGHHGHMEHIPFFDHWGGFRRRK